MITSATVKNCANPKCTSTARGLKAIKEIFGTRCEGIVLNPQSLCKPCRSADAARRRAAKVKTVRVEKFSEKMHNAASGGGYKKFSAPQIRKMYKEKFPEGRHKNINIMRKLLGL